jgi:Asp-tRNA(Asn)/Glu-tRNA(Gln) amidotransferase A subunit family amidase
LLTRTKLFYGVNYGHRAAKYDNLIHIMERSRGEGFGAEVKRRILLGMYERETDWHMRQPSF